jgi:predicted lipid-binding transport protein (Tim44 family)
MQDSQLLDIVLIAVTAVLLFRLYTVLGRRTGNERTREDYRLSGPSSAPRSGEQVVPLPDRGSVKPELARDAPGDPVAQGLLDIKLADRTFETEKFVSGARGAYELILTAFGTGDRGALKPLLNDEVFAAFDGVIRGREQRKEKVAFTFVGFKEVKIVHAAVKGRGGEITVSFAAQFISATTGETGKLIEGDTRTVRDVTDVWSFARDLRARDPNWTLVATSGELP